MTAHSRTKAAGVLAGAVTFAFGAYSVGSQAEGGSARAGSTPAATTAATSQTGGQVRRRFSRARGLGETSAWMTSPGPLD